MTVGECGSGVVTLRRVQLIVLDVTLANVELDSGETTDQDPASSAVTDR